MLRRFISYARYVGALVGATALALAVSVHAADPNRSLQDVRTLGKSLQAHFATALAPIGGLISRTLNQTETKLARLDLASRSPAERAAAPIKLTHDAVPVPPSILDFAISADGRAHVKGQAAANVRVALYSNGKVLADTQSSSSGAWQIDVDTRAAHGVHTLLAVAWRDDPNQRLFSERIRLAVPQRLPAPARAPQTAIAGGVASEIQLAQRDRPDEGRRARSSEDFDDRPSWTAPIFEWLRLSSKTYANVITRQLSGEDAGGAFVFEDDPRREPYNARDYERTERTRGRDDNQTFADLLRTRWQVLTTGIEEWLRRAQDAYRADIVDPLKGDQRRVARAPETDPIDVQADPFGGPQAPRAEPDFPDVTPPPPVRDDQQVTPVPREQPKQPGIERFDIPSTPLEPLRDWPVVGDVPPKLPELPAIEPDPEKRALIRKAEEDAKRARDLAQRAADQARKLREETEALLAEKERLDAEASARREAQLKQQLEEAERRATAAEQRARALSSGENRAAETETPPAVVAEPGDRAAAEDLAAAATEEADKRFADGGLDAPSSIGPQVAEGSQAGDVSPPSRERFSVADTQSAVRLSLKDSRRDRVIEEGSTMGEIDDFHPSVRFVYDMGGARPTKVKRKRALKKRAYRKKSARSKKAKRRGSYRKRKVRARKRAHVRRAHARRATRTRRARVRARKYIHRSARRWHKATRRFGRLYKFKPSARTHRKRRYARRIFIPRIKWR